MPRRRMKLTQPTRISDISDKFKFKCNDRGIYLENWAAPVQPPKINTFCISFEASHDSNISKYYSHTSIYVYHIIKENLNILFSDGLKTSLPILQRQCHPRTEMHDTIRAVLISHSSSCEKDRDHEA